MPTEPARERDAATRLGRRPAPGAASPNAQHGPLPSAPPSAHSSAAPGARTRTPPSASPRPPTITPRIARATARNQRGAVPWRPLLVVALIAAVLLSLRWWFAPGYHVADSQMRLYPGVSGPAEATPPLAAAELPLARDTCRGTPATRPALLLTDTESAWLGLVHGLRAVGLPLCITRDWKEALEHKVVIVYPVLSGRALGSEGLRTVARHPQNGGTLIAFHVVGGELFEVFGFSATGEVTSGDELLLDERSPLTARWQAPQERRLRFRVDQVDPPGQGLLGYEAPREALLRFADGRGALTRKDYAQGRAYAVGVDIGHLALKGHNARQEQRISTSYANTYTPLLDVLLRLLRDIVREAQPETVTLSPVPGGRDLAVAITHDVDYSRAVAHCADYAALESSLGVAATYFVQTKYVRDWNDDAFFDDSAVAQMRALAAQGFELASHSVAHAYTFSAFTLGDGRERYPDYRPFVKEQKRTYNASVLGELRVSRFLLEHFVPQQRVVSFRAGYLQNPDELPQALAATGYRYGSTLTANLALTHLPFQLKHQRGSGGEVPVYEFPITVEDELDAPMLGRLPQALALAEAIARDQGWFILLIHPDVTGQKLEFERRFIEAWRGRAAFATLAAHGAWWAARDAVTLDVLPTSAQALRLQLKAPQAIDGLTLQLPAGWRAAPAAGLRQDGTKLVIERLEGAREIPLLRGA